MSITKNIMKTNEYDTEVWYRTQCGCHSPDHDCTLVLEKDTDLHMINLVFYKKVSWADYYGKDNIISRFISRIKCSFKVLFTGHIELEESFCIMDEEHIDNFIGALEEGKQKLNKPI